MSAGGTERLRLSNRFDCSGRLASEWRPGRTRADCGGICFSVTHPYRNLGHGFGPSNGTSAEGWLAGAVRFWGTATGSKTTVLRKGCRGFAACTLVCGRKLSATCRGLSDRTLATYAPSSTWWCLTRRRLVVRGNRHAPKSYSKKSLPSLKSNHPLLEHRHCLSRDIPAQRRCAHCGRPPGFPSPDTIHENHHGSGIAVEFLDFSDSSELPVHFR